MGIGGNGQQHFDWIDDEWAEPTAAVENEQRLAKVAANTVVPGHGNRVLNTKFTLLHITIFSRTMEVVYMLTVHRPTILRHQQHSMAMAPVIGQPR